jgi:very-short-patch-repair endonuclease
VSKCYPAIFYPPLILKFLVKNPAPSFKQYYHQANNKLVNLSNKEGNFSNYFFIKLSDLFICITLIISIILSSFRLSPLWLVAVIWASICLGLFCFISTPTSLKNNKNISNLRQFPTMNQSKIAMRLLKREAELHRWLQGKILQPSGNSKAIAGVSEKAFYQILQRLFPDISQGVVFHNPKFSHPYSADFVLVHPSSLSIDIEIDEPYVGNTKAPHHCIDQGKDEIRNQFFTNNNWVVIRFSEKQAVKYPYRCCKVIAEVIARVAGDYTFLTQLKNVPNLPVEPMWTIKQAKNWANTNYRHTYLP